MQLLDRLNELLAKEANTIGLPRYRTKVYPAGENIKWIRRAIRKSEVASEELKTLIEKTLGELTKER